MAAKKPQLFKNDENGRNSANTHPNHTLLIGNRTPRPGEGLGHGPGSQERRKNIKNVGFSPSGAGYPSQKAKLSNRDQVGC